MGKIKGNWSICAGCQRIIRDPLGQQAVWNGERLYCRSCIDGNEIVRAATKEIRELRAEMGPDECGSRGRVWEVLIRSMTRGE